MPTFTNPYVNNKKQIPTDIPGCTVFEIKNIYPNATQVDYEIKYKGWAGTFRLAPNQQLQEVIKQKIEEYKQMG